MLSFIIPAYNEERELPATLDAVHASMKAIGLEYEIIVADDASDDRTAEIACERGAIVRTAEHRQISATRNSGASIARGDILFFVDADTRIGAQVVREALRAMNDGAAGGGALIHFDGDPPFYARALLPVLDRLFRLARLTGGCFMFCRREVFDAVGGFDEEFFASEEIHFARAIKRQGRFVVIKARVETSGRKLRMYTGWQLLCASIKLSAPGRAKQRSSLWYDGRREAAERR